MGSYIEDIKTKISQPGSYNRLNDTPLDRTEMFSSLADAIEYAKGKYATEPGGREEAHDSRKLAGVSYIGQTITVYEDGKVTRYQIQEDRTLGSIVNEIDCGSF